MLSNKTIVTALDADTEASSLLATARAIATTEEPASVYALHCVLEMPAAMQRVLFPFACLGDDHDAVIAQLLEAGQQSVKETLRQDGASIDDHSLRTIYGVRDQAILSELQRLGPDILVVGTGNPERVQPGMLGSLSGKLLRQHAGATLVVRKRSLEPQYKRVAALVDLQPSSSLLLSDAVGLADQWGASVQALHVLPTLHALDHNPAREEVRNIKDLRKSIDKQFRQAGASMRVPYPVRSRLSDVLQKPELTEGDPGKSIIDFALNEQIDLLVTFRCQPSAGSGQGLGRVTEYVVRHAPCDVLVVPPPTLQQSPG